MDQVYGWLMLTAIFAGFGYVLWTGLSDMRRRDDSPTSFTPTDHTDF